MQLVFKIPVVVAMNKVFCQKVQISIHSIQDFSIVMISEFELLANRCNTYVDFIIVVLKLLPKLAYIVLTLQCLG